MFFKDVNKYLLCDFVAKEDDFRQFDKQNYYKSVNSTEVGLLLVIQLFSLFPLNCR